MVVVTFYDIPILYVAIYHSMKRGMNLPLEKELPEKYVAIGTTHPRSMVVTGYLPAG